MVSTQSFERVRLPVPDMAEATRRYCALGFDLRAESQFAIVQTSTGGIELTSEVSARREVLVSAGDRAIPNGVPIRAIGKSTDTGPVAAHPNSVLELERVYIAVPDLGAVLSEYATALTLPAPPIVRGTVIRAQMAIFNVGRVGIGVATPFEDGPAARALARYGAGLFQVLFRVRSMGAAARWMTDHGLPPPARGTRNTGEQALLVEPDYAAGLYVALVGPE